MLRAITGSSGSSIAPTTIDFGSVQLFSKANMTSTVYRATANTNAARGVAYEAAFDAALAGDKITVGPGVYQLTATKSILDDLEIEFQNAQFLTNANGTTGCLNANGVNNWSIIGSAKWTGTAAGGGVVSDEYWLKTQGAIVNFGITGRFEINNFKGACMYFTHSEVKQDSAHIYGVTALFCGWGFNATAGAEYIKAVGCSFNQCTIGVYDAGGNNNFSACNMTNSGTNVYMDIGSNHGHCLFTGCSINHGTTYNLYINGTTLPTIFAGCHFAQGGIFFNGGSGVQILGGAIFANSTITLGGVAGQGYHYLRDVQFYGGNPTITTATNGDTKWLRIENCNDLNSNLPYSSNNFGYVPQAGGTGNSVLAAAGLPVIPYEGAYTYYDNTTLTPNDVFKRTSGDATLTHIGTLNQTNANNPVTITSAQHGVKGLILKGSTDTDPAAIAPLSLTPLVWYDVNAQGLGNNAAIGTITDGGSAAKNATQATAGFKPTNITNVLNGKAVARFFGGQVLETASITQAQPMTFYIVCRSTYRDNNASYLGVPMIFASAPFPAYNFSYTAKTGTVNAGSTPTFSIDITKWNIIEVVLNGASSTVSVNGSADVTINPGAGSAASVLRIGAFGTTPTAANALAFIGDLALCGIFGSALSLANREGIRRSLSNSYGIPITNGTTGASTAQTAALLDIQNSAGTSVIQGDLTRMTLGNGQAVNSRNVTAAGAITVATTDYQICVNKTVGAATTVNLPASPVNGQACVIKDLKGDALINNITITPASGNIDNAATYVMATNGQSTTVVYNTAAAQWTVN